MDDLGTNETVLSNLDAGGVTQFAWSPDGQQLLFAATHGDDRRIFIVDADGTGHQRLTEFDSWDPSWSRDGERIAVSSSDGIYVLNRNGLNRRRLTTFKAWAPRWSRNDDRIGYLADRGIDGQLPELWLVNMDGSNPLRVSAPGCMKYEWSTRWKWLLCISPTTDQSAFKASILDLATGKVLQVAESSEPSFSWTQSIGVQSCIANGFWWFLRWLFFA